MKGYLRHPAFSGAVLAALLALAAAPAEAALFVPGSTFQVQGSNSPGSFTDTVTLAPGTTLLDQGALALTISIVPDAGASEWLVFSYATTGGSALSQPGSYWSLSQNGLDAAVGVNFTAAYVQFSHGGSVLTPTGNIFPGYGIETSPVPGLAGTGLGVGGFVAPFAAGPLPALGAFISPWSYLNATGIDSSQVNGYVQALEFSPTVPVPEPATWILAALGLALLAAVRCRPAGDGVAR